MLLAHRPKMGEWDEYLDQYLTNEKTSSDGTNQAACFAALANRSDYAFYAASPSAGEAGWAGVFAEDQERPKTEEDGSESKVMINEAATLKEAVETNVMKGEKASGNGLWIGGEKHRVATYRADYECGDAKVIHVNCPAKDGKGAHILATEKSVLVALYDKKKGVSAENCLPACHAFAEYLAGQGL